MPTPDELRSVLQRVAAAAVNDATSLLTLADPRTALIEASMPLVSYYADGTAALAADYYDDLREAASPPHPYTAATVIDLDEERLRRAAIWATEPLLIAEPDLVLASSRVAEMMQPEVVQPFRDTITGNQARDPDAVGYRRNASGSACRFCQMLAARGAVFRESTAHFASHPGCHCTASVVFNGEAGPEASVMQYVASQPNRTESQQQALRNFLAAMPD